MFIHKALPYLRTPQAFLILMALSALLTAFCAPAGMVFASVSLFVCFRPKAAAVIWAVWLSAYFLSNSSAFVLDMDYSAKERTLITTKGYLKGIEGDIAVGDLLRGKFRYERYRLRGFPRLKAYPEGKFRAHRVPGISYLLEKRHRQASLLFNRSGGIITTTPAHICAVRSYIPDRLQDQYVITGLAHLLAMSGTHVAIFTGGIFLLFSFLPRRLRAIPVIVLLPLLIPLSGFTVTVVRAVIFALAAMVAWALDLKVTPLKFLALVAGGILLFSPYSLFSISFLLSFFAVFGILAVFSRFSNPVLGIVMIGVASTVFTQPLQLYFFGTSNLFSVVSTVIFTPVVWMQMMLGALSFVFPSAMIAPLSIVERFGNWLMEHTYAFSWHFLFLSKPPTAVLVAAFTAAVVLCFTRLRWLSVLTLLLPLLPLYPEDVLIFPVLPASQKGYILTSEKGSEIFFRGRRSSFVKVMVPEAGRLGIKHFDHGKVELFDGENLYLKVRDDHFTSVVCVNEDAGCPYMFSTRSNALKAPLNEDTLAFIIYNNKPVDPRIILQSETGEIRIPLKNLAVPGKKEGE